ncbi:helix-turn-helix domain-containing protein [Sphingomonas oryzagri]
MAPKRLIAVLTPPSSNVAAAAAPFFSPSYCWRQWWSAPGICSPSRLRRARRTRQSLALRPASAMLPTRWATRRAAEARRTKRGRAAVRGRPLAHTLKRKSITSPSWTT